MFMVKNSKLFEQQQHKERFSLFFRMALNQLNEFI